MPTPKPRLVCSDATAARFMNWDMFICPKLSEVQYLQPDNPDEKRDFHSISHQKLGRCRMLVVCGSEISNSMSAEIGAAEKKNIICTTLDGLAKIKEANENGRL